ACLDRSGEILVWNVVTGELKCRLPGKLLPDPRGGYLGEQSIAFSKDGKTLVWAGNDNRVRSWDISNGKLINEATVPSHAEVALPPGGRLLAIAEKEQVTILDTQTGDPLVFLPKGNVHRLFFTPDARVLSIIETGTPFRLVEVASGSERVRLEVEGRADISPDGRLLARSMPDGTVVVWDLAAVVGADRKR